MPPQPKRYFPGWSRLLAPQRGPFPHTQPGDIDHPDVPPRVGPRLLSAQGRPSPADGEKTVLLTAHGFAATPFENHYLLDWLLQQSPDCLGSRVMLGGHGESADAFRRATWQDWQAPLETELRALHQLGYQKQVAITTSTGGTLLLELLSRQHFPALKKLVLVAPLVEPVDKVMRLAGLGRRSGLIGSVRNTFDEDWIGCWYRELPIQAIEQLDIVTRKLRELLRRGLRLPSDLQILIVQSRREVIVDRRSAYLITDGLIHNHVELLMLDSHWHLLILPRREEPREEAIKNWVYGRIEEFLQREALPPDRWCES